LKTPNKSTTRRKTGQTSQFFTPTPTPKKIRSPPGTVSIIKFPPLSSPTFGLIQEEFAHDAFKLLIAVMLLNKTRGTVAIPVFRSIISIWPSPHALAAAAHDELLRLLEPLGLQNKRAAALLELAQTFVHDPPIKGRRYRTLHYPLRDAGKDVKADEILTDDDPRLGAWEIAHLKSMGVYAWDSWRIFCRDELRGVASGYNGEDDLPITDGDSFEPEWKRVQPGDKELRAFLRWMWLREGILWNPETGEKMPANDELMRRAERGEVGEWGDEIALLNDTPRLGQVEIGVAKEQVANSPCPTPRTARASYETPLGSGGPGVPGEGDG
jgi:methyl-CpG-binding domain protein 4